MNRIPQLKGMPPPVMLHAEDGDQCIGTAVEESHNRQKLVFQQCYDIQSKNMDHGQVILHI